MAREKNTRPLPAFVVTSEGLWECTSHLSGYRLELCLKELFESRRKIEGLEMLLHLAELGCRAYRHLEILIKFDLVFVLREISSSYRMSCHAGNGSYSSLHFYSKTGSLRQPRWQD